MKSQLEIRQAHDHILATLGTTCRRILDEMRNVLRWSVYSRYQRWARFLPGKVYWFQSSIFSNARSRESMHMLDLTVLLLDRTTLSVRIEDNRNVGELLKTLVLEYESVLQRASKLLSINLSEWNLAPTPKPINGSSTMIINICLFSLICYRLDETRACGDLQSSSRFTAPKQYFHEQYYRAPRPRPNIIPRIVHRSVAVDELAKCSLDLDQLSNHGINVYCSCDGESERTPACTGRACKWNSSKLFFRCWTCRKVQLRRQLCNMDGVQVRRKWSNLSYQSFVSPHVSTEFVVNSNQDNVFWFWKNQI